MNELNNKSVTDRSYRKQRKKEKNTKQRKKEKQSKKMLLFTQVLGPRGRYNSLQPVGHEIGE